MGRRAMLVVVACVLASVAVARAEPLTAGAFSFSDELGGIRLQSVSGTGTAEDPIVLVEEFLSSSPAALTIRRLPDVPSPVEAPPQAIPTTLNLRKIVINRTKRVWVGFDLELEEIRGRPSTYHDGLSFDQFYRKADQVNSDRFQHGERMFEPRDRIQFFRGSVDPDHAVRFTLLITDASPSQTFYLVQQPQFVVAGSDRPDWKTTAWMSDDLTGW